MFQGSNFRETTLEWRLRLENLAKMFDKQHGAHQGVWICWSPSRHATFTRRSSLHSVMKSPHFIWQRLMNLRICSVVNVDILSKYSPLIWLRLNTSLYPPRPIASSQFATSNLTCTINMILQASSCCSRKIFLPQRSFASSFASYCFIVAQLSGICPSACQSNRGEHLHQIWSCLSPFGDLGRDSFASIS